MRIEIFNRRQKIFTEPDEIELGLQVDKYLVREKERVLRQETKEENKRTKKALKRLKQFKG